jgi:peptide-methionine (S)-S-oxide reductase
MGFLVLQSTYMKTIYLGAGGFWIPEAVYKRVKGVEEVIPGYMGGTVSNPTYEIVATGTTGHIEVVKIIHDESIVSTEALLRLFYTIHDAAVQQHPSVGIGSQYRAAIFYTDDTQAEAIDPGNGEDVGRITKLITRVQATLPEGTPVSTHIRTAGEFYPAEEQHYDFYGKNPYSAYATEVIRPMLEMARAQHSSLFID